MATATTSPDALSPSPTPTLGEVLAGLTPGVPVGRVLVWPHPGTATVADVEGVRLRESRLCELVDGVLVEKTMGTRESSLAVLLGYHLLAFLLPRRLGVVMGADGMIRLKPDQVRIPDLAVYLSARLPEGKLPDEAIASVVPDLVVEILSPSNTPSEMDRKLGEYFAAGVRLVWYVDPRSGTVRVYQEVDRMVELDRSGMLEGGDILPGFAVRVGDWLT